VGGGHHKHDRKRREKSSTKSGSKREKEGQDCKDGRRWAGGLATCRYNAGRRTGEAPTAAAAAEAQTAAKTAAKTTARTQTEVSTRTLKTVGDPPTAGTESEGARWPRPRLRPRPCPDRWIKHGGETPGIKESRECTAPQQNGPGNCISDQQSALPPEGTGPCLDCECKKKC